MVSTDPIADMLTRIRNAIAVRKVEVSMPHSKMKQSVAQLLVDNRYLSGTRVEGDGIEKTLVITLPEVTQITEIDRVSKPGRRTYAKAKEIPVVKQGRGLVIMSTSQGIMTGADAKQKRLGGEVICKVY